MKIVCDSCGAKYKIADEKVAGKVFKIRCKRCSAAIIVRGEQGDSASGPPAAAARPSEEGVWYAVVQGEQQGPMTAAQFGELVSNGQADWETYVWREGFDNWLPAREVEALQQMQAPQATAPQARPAAMGPMGMGADPFADLAGDDGNEGPTQIGSSQSLFGATPSAAPKAKESGVASRANRGSNADLFAEPSPAAAMRSNRGGLGASAAAVPAASKGGGLFAPSAGDASESDANLTGARNENSILFSLSNLQALATGPADAPASPGNRAPAIHDEGSGLIDIRALATAASAPRPAAAMNKPTDDILSIASSHTPFTPVLSAPVLAPARSQGGNKMWIAIAGTAVGVLGLVAIAWAVFGNKSEPPSDATAAIGTTQPQPGAPPTTGAPVAPAVGTGSPQQAAAPSNTAAAPRQENDNQERGGSERSGSRRRERESASGRAASGSGQTATAPVATRGEPSGGASGGGGGGGGNSDIDALLNRALGSGGGGGGGARARTAEPAAGGGGGGGLPETPSKSEVLAALRSVQGAVAACGQGQSGVASTSITVSGSSGRVTNATVSGQFAGTPVGSCVARAVRGASFPRFSRSTFQISFPFRL